MFNERIMLFKLGGLWQVLRLKYFESDKYEDMEKDVEDIHEMKDARSSYDPDDFVDILKGIDYKPQGSLRGLRLEDIHGGNFKWQ